MEVRRGGNGGRLLRLTISQFSPKSPSRYITDRQIFFLFPGEMRREAVEGRGRERKGGRGKKVNKEGRQQQRKKEKRL